MTKLAITLIGMSGVGKTTLSNKLPKNKWFHYSGDYRIGTKYLSDYIGDFLKSQAMNNELLAPLLASDSIKITANLTVSNLAVLSAYVGKLGKKDLGGLDLDTFLLRQRQHRIAEIKACYDVGYFIEKSKNIYDYDYFMFDAGGSICELEDEDVIDYLAHKTKIVYIKADDKHQELLVERALSYPKPMYYNESFLLEQIDQYKDENKLTNIEDCEPNSFIKFIIPKLMGHRSELYQKMAEKYGVIISAEEAYSVTNEQDFIELVNSKSK